MPYFKGVYFAEVPSWAEKNPVVKLEETVQELDETPRFIEASSSPVMEESSVGFTTDDIELSKIDEDLVSLPLTVKEPASPKKRKSK